MLDIQGLWSLKSLRSPEEGAQPASGYLRYGHDGWMNVVLMKGLPPSHEFWTSYTGTYQLYGDYVEHYPQLGFSPNGLGPKKRYVRRQKHQLILSTSPEGKGTVLEFEQHP